MIIVEVEICKEIYTILNENNIICLHRIILNK